jgi:hypothetical protein
MTPKRERFCQEIVKGKSQADAYRVAFRTKQMKAQSIHKRASELMAVGEVRGRIGELRAPVIAKVQWSLEERMAELRHAGQLDPIHLYDENGQPKRISDMPEHARRAIAGFEIDAEKFTTKIKLVDKRGAIMDYTKLAGDMPAEQHELKAELTVEHLVALLTKKAPTVIHG